MTEEKKTDRNAAGMPYVVHVHITPEHGSLMACLTKRWPNTVDYVLREHHDETAASLLVATAERDTLTTQLEQAYRLHETAVASLRAEFAQSAAHAAVLETNIVVAWLVVTPAGNIPEDSSGRADYIEMLGDICAHGSAVGREEKIAKVAQERDEWRDKARAQVIAWFDEHKDQVVRDIGHLNGELEKEVAKVMAERDKAVHLLTHCTNGEHPDIREFIDELSNATCSRCGRRRDAHYSGAGGPNAPYCGPGRKGGFVAGVNDDPEGIRDLIAKGLFPNESAPGREPLIDEVPNVALQAVARSMKGDPNV